VTTRREFLWFGAAAAASLAGCRAQPERRRIGPDRKIRLGIAGTGNRGRENLQAVRDESVVALCDVDAGYLRQAAAEFPAARTYRDWRDLLAAEALDALVVSTPDHTHACIAAAALARGLDVYVEKPLAHDVHETRRLRQLAAERGAITQMGTQIHALANYRRVVEAVRSGALGAVREVHVFVNGSCWSGRDRPPAAEPPPALDFELWLGPAPAQPFTAQLHPADWRRWWDFGGGTMADMACHFLDLPFWALGLGAPEWIEARGAAAHPVGAPPGLRVDYRFAGGLGLHWYDGDVRPEILRPLGLDAWRNGVLFVGERGHLIADYHRHEVGPAAFAARYVPPAPSIPASPGHHREWLQAIRTREPASCDFAYAGPLTEAVLLGVASHRAGAGLAWDAARGQVTNTRAADRYLRRVPRAGWELS
jgi:predicted dehydrogenase